jgi:hypothetical protein
LFCRKRRDFFPPRMSMDIKESNDESEQVWH